VAADEHTRARILGADALIISRSQRYSISDKSCCRCVRVIKLSFVQAVQAFTEVSVKAIAKIILVGAAAVFASSLSAEAECRSCKAVECSFDTQCGIQCLCIKLDGNIKGNCVQK
jgi:hypothetical protein